MVARLFLAVPRGCLQFVIVVFPDLTHYFLLKIVSVSIMLCYVHVQYEIPQQLNLTDIGNLTLYALIIVMDSSNGLGKFHYIYQGVTGYYFQKSISFSEDILWLSKRCRP